MLCGQLVVGSIDPAPTQWFASSCCNLERKTCQLPSYRRPSEPYLNALMVGPAISKMAREVQQSAGSSPCACGSSAAVSAELFCALGELNDALLKDIGISRTRRSVRAQSGFGSNEIDDSKRHTHCSLHTHIRRQSMSRASILTATLLVLLQGTQVAAQPVCKPAVTVRNVGFSEAVNLRRFWTAIVDVDASQCTTASGFYSLGFVRTAASGTGSGLRPTLHLASGTDERPR